MKKIIYKTLMISLFIIVIFSIKSFATSDFSYTLDTNGDATITAYNGTESNLTIPSTIDGHKVISIGEHAFDESMNTTNGSIIKNLVISEGIEKIELLAFAKCTNLETVKLPESLNSIAMQAFLQCSKLKSINIPSKIESIGNCTFQETALTEINIPKNVKSIDFRAFGICANLEKVRVYSTDINYASGVFEYGSSNLVLYGYEGSTTQTYAQTNGIKFENLETRSLGAQMERPFDPSNSLGKKYQYAVNGKTEGSTIWYTVVKIHDETNEDFSKYTKPIYCLRGGKGFGKGEEDPNIDVSQSEVSYIQEEKSEMHENAKEVIAKYKDLYGINLDRTETINSKEVNIYNAILWILDESYLPKDKVNAENEIIYSSSEYKEELLDKAEVPKTQQGDITDNDIEVIQQLAIWYFANYDEQTAKTNPTVSQSTMYPTQFLSNNIDTRIANNLDRLYQYLIYGAIGNSSTYVINEETGERTKEIEKNEFDKTTQLTITSNDSLELYNYYQIGPVKIKSDLNEGTGRKEVDSTNIVLYDAQGNPIPKIYIIPKEDEDDNETGKISYHTIYEFVDGDGEEVTSLQKGLEYYIRFYKFFEKGSDAAEYITEDDKYDLSKVSIKMQSSYTISTATFMYAEKNAGENQAVVEIDKEKYSDSDEITTKVFDLALRKFITSINGRILSGEETRIPKISTSTLINGTNNDRGIKEYTATYVHPKNAIEVEKGDKIVYTIRIYNEGEIDGTATEVTDYLPDGLELVPNSESVINTEYNWTTTDGKTIKTDYLKDEIIHAFVKDGLFDSEWWQVSTEYDNGLFYRDLEIECRVIADNSNEDVQLRNIAEITEDTGDDRDSTPNNIDKTNYNPTENNSTYQQDDDDYEDLILKTKSFDLALRKSIIKVNEKELTGEESRLPNVDITPLKGTGTTANYKHKKDPVEVKTGDVVTYKFTVYNEGDIKGYVYSITDYLPEGLEFDAESNPEFIEYDETKEYTESEIEGKKYLYSIDEEKNTITISKLAETTTDGGLKPYLFDLEPFDGERLDSKSINVKFKVTAKETLNDQILTNVATMDYTSAPRPQEEKIKDRDSKPEEFTEPTAEKLLESLPGYKGNEENKTNLADSTYYYKGQQDDDDFEKIIIKGKNFDLSLRKYITKINGEELEESREPKIDTSKLATGEETTAKYIHSKEAITVKKGDIVTYKIRIYNEGERDGYATKVTDYIPEGLGLVYKADGSINSDWILPENISINSLYGTEGIYETEENVLRKDAYKEIFGEEINLSEIQIIQGKEEGTMLEVTAGGKIGETELKATKIIKAYKSEKTEGDQWQQSINDEKDGLFYQELEITCIVLKENTYKGILKNVAEITAAEDAEGNEIKNIGDDRDSEPNNVYADGTHTPGTEVNGYTPGEQDDDDFEPLQLKYFDLALRKFITKIDGKEPEETREPEIDLSTLVEGTYNRNGKTESTATYKHTKEPLLVANGSNVEYTIRIYNEGTENGYAYEISDDIPKGLIYDPENETNKNYEWEMYREITEEEKIEEKDIIEYNNKKYTITEEAEEAEMIRTKYLENKEIKAFDAENKELSYEDVKVVFIVNETEEIDTNKIIINKAQITKDSGEDEDSIPNEWKDEDDEDIEKVRIPIFDLSLLKWVTKTIVTVDGTTKTTETGFEPNTGKTETTGIRGNEEAEPIAKVEIDKKKIDKTTVKFAYKIRVTNEGEIAGYATKLTDFIPEGLEFKEEDNKTYGWEKEGENKVTTRALETVKLEPGESAEVEIVFTWKNNANNLGIKTNIAEITEDYNEYDTKDIDSTPNNKKDPYEKEQEDDDDFALVILSIQTGKEATYIVFTTTMITLLAVGIFLVKRYVLTY